MSKTILFLSFILSLVATATSLSSAERLFHSLHQKNNNKLSTPQPGNAGSFTLIYESAWPTTYLHYNADGKGWNAIPGAQMSCPTNTSAYPCAKYAQISVWGNNVVFVTTDGTGQWDNDGGKNYDASQPGIWLLQAGNLQQVSAAPAGCPDACSGHGTCTMSTFTCVCNGQYFGATCQYICPSNCTANLHEQCSSQNGQCECQPGWAKCGAQTACMTNTGSDINNCGGCGNNCLNSPNVIAATCVSGQCNVTQCANGYENCNDGTCRNSCPLPGCQVFQLNDCVGNQINTSTQFANNNWQTPPRNSPSWHASWQDYSDLKGYTQYKYTADHKSVLLNVYSQTKDSTAVVTCAFGPAGTPFGSCQKLVSAPTKGPMQVRVRATIPATGKVFNLHLEDVDFMWDHPDVNAIRSAGPNGQGDYRGGQKGAIVELWGWKWNQVALECPFLAKAGYLGAKIYPPNEHVMSPSPLNNSPLPWWLLYQPVSYRLQSRLGTRDELRNMINTCRGLGVEIYADVVTNHVSGGGNDANPSGHRNGQGNSCTYWGPKNTSASFPPVPGDVHGCSPYFTQPFTFEPAIGSNLPVMNENPAVPYGPLDYHCNRPLNSWNDPLDLNAGYLSGLVDLNTESDYVRQRIADYYTDLLSIGVSGFRVDAAKHIQPPDLGAIYGKLKQNLGGVIPSDLKMYLEVLIGGEAELLLCNPDSGYSYSAGLVQELQKNGLTEAEIDQITIWFDPYPNDYGEDCGQLSNKRKTIQNDDSDQQNPGSTSRDMHGKGSILVIEKNIPLHRQFEIQLFTNPLGVPDNDNDSPLRNVLSSFWLPADENDYGLPDGLSQCQYMTEFSSSCNAAQELPNITAHEPGAPGYTGNFIGGHFTRVHRDNQIINAMRSWMHLPPVDTSGPDWKLI